MFQTKYRLRIWTPNRLDDRWVVVDPQAVVDATSLPIPVKANFSDEHRVGFVESLAVVGGNIDGVMLGDPGLVADAVPAANFRAWTGHVDGKRKYLAESLYEVGLTEAPTVAGTWIKPMEDDLGTVVEGQGE
jgi:hypothetical protein